MARERGTFNFSASLEVKKQGALDARQVVQTYSELILKDTWVDSDGKVWLYDGLLVSIVESGKLYMLTDKDNYTSTSSWKEVDASSAIQIEVINNLSSTSTTSALSANMGKTLDEAKVDKVEGKQLSTEDYTTEEKTKLSGIAEGAQVNVIEGIQVDSQDLPASGKKVNIDLSKKVDKVDGSRLITNEEAEKLEGIEAGAQVNKVNSVAGKTGDVTLSKNDVGLGNVDNTSDIDKPVSTLQQAAINSVKDSLDEFKSTKGQANGLATLDENGKIPVSQLNGQLARVQGVDEVVISTTLPEEPEDEYMVWCTDDKKFREYNGSDWDVIDPVGDTIYNFRNSDATGDEERTNILYRWDGSDLVEISASIALGESSGTAYEGSKGKANADAIASLQSELSKMKDPSQEGSFAKDIQGLKDKDTAIDNYTINSKKISTNPVLSGADLQLTSYSKPGEGGIITTTDTINSAIGKLEKNIESLDIEIGNPSSQEEPILPATGIYKIIEDNEKTTAESLVDLDTRIGNPSEEDTPATGVYIEIEKKVDKESGKSLVSDELISKLESLKDQTELQKSIDEAKQAGLDASQEVKDVTGQSTGNYVANSSANYIKTATSLNDADLKLDAQLKLVSDKVDTINGEESVTGSFRKGDKDTLDQAKAYTDTSLTWYEA